MHIAIEGCAHGELDIIYNTIKRLEDMHKFKIDLLLCCGDFQSVRNEGDLRCMAVPPKYMQMQDFHRYYSGEMKAPILTIFIGGNHEASNYLQELPYGGWVAPNIYYLGYAGVVQVGDLRIGGLSGIYKGSDYMKGHFEKSPYNGSTMRSVYHIRNLEVFRLKQLSGKTNIFMSHDWPRGIYHHGNVEELLRYKEHFRKEISDNSLGSRPAEDLIKKMKPQYWFSGHLHVKFAALLDHKGSNGKNGYRVTKFLALDKCLPRREFLQVLELPSTTPKKIELKHDAEWLTILRLTNHLLNTTSKIMYMPGPGANERYNFTPTAEEIEKTVTMLGGDLTIHENNFVRTAKCFSNPDSLPNMNKVSMPQPVTNPQTTKLCSLLGIDDPLNKNGTSNQSVNTNVSFDSNTTAGPFNRSEMNITMNSSLQTTCESINQSNNPEEVNLSDGDELEFCKEEEDESGDIIFEVPCITTSNAVGEKISDIDVSPIFTKSLRPKIFSSPISSSPRTSVDELPKLCSSLSTTTETDLDVSDLNRSPSLNVSFEPLNISSSQSEEESDSTERSQSLKRDSSSCDEIEGGSSSSESPIKKSKKLKRRNDSIYSNS
ncbi:UNVERIFIED_CONTAM: hypothetical protein RMT77_001829 [Armadillidium vulgare]